MGEENSGILKGTLEDNDGFCPLCGAYLKIKSIPFDPNMSPFENLRRHAFEIEDQVLRETYLLNLNISETSEDRGIKSAAMNNVTKIARDLEVRRHNAQRRATMPTLITLIHETEEGKIPEEIVNIKDPDKMTKEEKYGGIPGWGGEPGTHQEKKGS